MAFMCITEDEAVYIMAAIGRVSDHDHPDNEFGVKLLDKIGSCLTVTELHEVEHLYKTMRFSRVGDTSVNMVELYHSR